MSFTSGIPASGQSLGQTRDAIRNNFTNYNNTISVNHVAPNNAGAGKHNLSEFVVQAQSPATTNGEVALYSRSISGIPQLFLQKQNQVAAAADIQMSRVDTGALAASNGYSFLPGGAIIQWGSAAGVINNQVITFPIAFPNNVWSLQISGGINVNPQPTINFYQSSLTVTQFNTRIDGTTPISIYWIAIGN